MRDVTPEQQEQLANLQARLGLQTRYSAPPPEEADQWVGSMLDIDHEGRTFYNIPVWHPRLSYINGGGYASASILKAETFWR